MKTLAAGRLVASIEELDNLGREPSYAAEQSTDYGFHKL